MKFNFLVIFLLALILSFSSVGQAQYGIDTKNRSGQCLLFMEMAIEGYYKLHENVLDKLDHSKADVDIQSYKVEPVKPKTDAKNDSKRILTKEEQQRIYYKFKESITQDLAKAVRSYDALVKPVIDPQEGFLTKIMMARKAKYSLYIGTYIFKADSVGNPLLHEAKEALKRGVSVKMLIDSGGSPSLFHGELKALQEYAAKNAGFTTDPKTGKLTNQRATVDTVMFNPMNVATKILRNFFRRAFNLTAPSDSSVDIVKSWINRRNHSKLFGIDFEDPELAMFITGGRNLDESYYAIPEKSDKTYNDVEILVRNKPGAKKDDTITDEVADFYNKIFYHLGNKWLSRSIVGVLFGMYDKHIENMTAVHTQIMGREDIAAKFKNMVDSDYLNSGFEDAQTELLNTVDNVLRRHVANETGGMDNPENAALKNPSHIYTQILKAMGEAKSKITIVTPYPDFTPEAVTLLQKWLAEDPKRELVVFTNSIMTSDNMPAQINVDEVVGKLFGNTAQTKVYEYGQLDAKQLGGTVAYGKVHAKYLIFDDKKVIVGTFNFDDRSDFLNVEVMVGVTPVIQNSATVQAYINQANIWIGQSYLVGTPEWQQLRDNHKLGAPKRFVADDMSTLKILQKIFDLEWIF